MREVDVAADFTFRGMSIFPSLIAHHRAATICSSVPITHGPNEAIIFLINPCLPLVRS